MTLALIPSRPASHHTHAQSHLHTPGPWTAALPRSCGWARQPARARLLESGSRLGLWGTLHRSRSGLENRRWPPADLRLVPPSLHPGPPATPLFAPLAPRLPNTRTLHSGLTLLVLSSAVPGPTDYCDRTPSFDRPYLEASKQASKADACFTKDPIYPIARLVVPSQATKTSASAIAASGHRDSSPCVSVPRSLSGCDSRSNSVKVSVLIGTGSCPRCVTQGTLDARHRPQGPVPQ